MSSRIGTTARGVIKIYVIVAVRSSVINVITGRIGAFLSLFQCCGVHWRKRSKHTEARVMDHCCEKKKKRGGAI